MLIFGFDIGTTSIGFAVIEHEPSLHEGKILRLGARIFPESRDPKTLTSLNQERRSARMRRRQFRRRRKRRQFLSEQLSAAGLLPSRDSREWDRLMRLDPYALRLKAFKGENLTAEEAGRAIYHVVALHRFRP